MVNFDNPNHKCPLHKGGQIKFYNEEKKLYEFIIFNRKLGNSNTTTSVSKKLLEFNPEEIKSDKEALLKRIYIYRKRYNLS